ncbi:GNAT family N-acetyltransferase [Janibacter melonis]|uniref:GNAT family N-acetyltransferase n=1 Tax=Janibacter melonis TaxID=262209 RepID=UPI001F468972|nr:GNAT family N-acetyltransferase [Janibacter melonis]
MTSPHLPMPDLAPGLHVVPPTHDDVAALAALATAQRRAVTGSGSVGVDEVAMEVTGIGSWTRRQLLVRDGEGGDAPVVAWARVHDRAAGRTNVELTVAPDRADGDEIAASLLRWAEEVGVTFAAFRGLGGTLLDVSVRADDETYRRRLEAAGYEAVRTWLQMSRPVTEDDAGLPGPREGVVVRRVATHEDGMPVAEDVQTVHRMLEESFADHFNSYRESFAEFVQRQREATGHRWDHWWIAEIDVDGQWVPGGAVVSSVSGRDADGRVGSYVDYIGVHRLARGRGVAKALLHTVIRDALERGRDRVALEVDADSPTGADGLYESMGWTTAYRTTSFHRHVEVPGADAPVPVAKPIDDEG